MSRGLLLASAAAAAALLVVSAAGAAGPTPGHGLACAAKRSAVNTLKVRWHGKTLYCHRVKPAKPTKPTPPPPTTTTADSPALAAWKPLVKAFVTQQQGNLDQVTRALGGISGILAGDAAATAALNSGLAALTGCSGALASAIPTVPDEQQARDAMDILRHACASEATLATTISDAIRQRDGNKLLTAVPQLATVQHDLSGVTSFLGIS